MKKFFLFRKEEINVTSVTASDDGRGLSVLALPADNLAFASADKGHVVLSFNGATKYEESNLTDGESVEKTTVKIPCEEGKEVDLIESILAFISTDSKKHLMRFDAVDEKSTFSPVSFDNKIESIVPVNPVKRATGTFGASDEITSWANAGTGGSAYNIATNVGTPSCHLAGEARGMATKSAGIQTGDHFVIPTITIEKHYTLYVVASIPDARPVFSDADGECVGFTYQQYKDATNGAVDKVKGGAIGKFAMRHHDRFGNIPIVDLDSFEYPDLGESSSALHVFVIRRDSENRLFMYGNNGDVVAVIPALSVDGPGGPYTKNTDNLTDGDLKIERLGTVRDLTNSFQFTGNICRFGVISKDIGDAACSKLATDLFNLYKI